MRYASPVIDIVYFIYLCTDSEFRSQHFFTLQDLYYDSLKQFLNLYQLDVSVIYPNEEFVKDLNYYMPLGLLVALVELRVITTTPEDDAILRGSSLAGNSNTSEVPGENNLFIHRVNDVVNEFVSNGLLDSIT